MSSAPPKVWYHPLLTCGCDGGSASTSTCYFNKKPFLQKVEHVFKAHVLQICSLFLI